MHIPDIGSQLNKWLRDIAKMAESAVEKPRKALMPAATPGGIEPPEESPAAESGGLYSLLDRPPQETGDGRMLALCRAQVEGCGEDACLAARDRDRVFIGAFDGCGGSGAKVYPAFGGHTGAWAASRAAALAARGWFMDGAADDSAGGPADGGLAGCIERALKACRDPESDGPQLLGSLSREFPTTVAAFAVSAKGDEADFYWCGDSRCYALDADGLHQITADDAAIRDAMRNLREDAPMTNVACASRPFRLHHARLAVKKPAVLFAATDGCFGYLPSPMAFERLLLETLHGAAGMKSWRKALDARIRAVSGDDYTLVAWLHRFDSYKAMRRALSGRLAQLNRDFPPDAASEEALFAQWERYRPGYERMLTDDDERG